MQGFNMGKYVPPEHEGTISGNRLHNKHALGARASKLRSDGALTVRFEMPYAIWCATCPKPTIIGQGVRFNAEKRRTGRYHTTPIWTFRLRHAVCGGAIEMRTDPQNTAYVIVSGATKRDVGTDKNAELEGGVPILTEAEREALRSNAFASLEKTIKDREMARDAEERIDGLVEVAARQWEDPYALNQKLRKAFRVGRKEREARGAATEALKDRMSLGMDILDETEEDGQRARLVDFAPEGSLLGEEAALAKPLFNAVTATGKETAKSDEAAGLTRDVRRKMKSKESFATQVVGNTRVAKDPFLLSTSATRGRRGEVNGSMVIPGIKRRREVAPSSSVATEDMKQQSSSTSARSAALVEYDSE